MKVYQSIASTLQAWRNCAKSGNSEWKHKHQQNLLRMARDLLPSGSGLDEGTQISFGDSTDEKLVFTTNFHHMDDNGSYVEWTGHTIVVRASLTSTIEIDVKGRNTNDIKDYLWDVFHHALTQETPRKPGEVSDYV